MKRVRDLAVLMIVCVMSPMATASQNDGTDIPYSRQRPESVAAMASAGECVDLPATVNGDPTVAEVMATMRAAVASEGGGVRFTYIKPCSLQVETREGTAMIDLSMFDLDRLTNYLWMDEPVSGIRIYTVFIFGGGIITVQLFQLDNVGLIVRSIYYLAQKCGAGG